MEVSIIKNLVFKSWDEDNKNRGMLNKFVKVYFALGNEQKDITEFVIKAYGFNKSRKGRNQGAIANYSCYGFSLEAIVKESIKSNESPLVQLLISEFIEK